MGWLVVLGWLVGAALSFNFDTAVPVVKFGDSGTLFGYSVAIHKVSEGDSAFEGTNFR